MPKIDIKIAGLSYVLKSDESPEHLDEVANLVKKRVEILLKKNPKLDVSRAAMLAAFDFASQLVKGNKRSGEFKSGVLTKAKLLLDKVENDLGHRSSHS